MNKNSKIFNPNMSFKDNNRKTYYSFLEEYIDNEKEHDNNSDVIGFIDSLSKDGSYVFNKNVIIKTNENEYDTRIAGRLGNKIITLDNDSININDIVDIYEKNKK